jgi:hypothetical protein
MNKIHLTKITKVIYTSKMLKSGKHSVNSLLARQSPKIKQLTHENCGKSLDRRYKHL